MDGARRTSAFPVACPLQDLQQVVHCLVVGQATPVREEAPAARGSCRVRQVRCTSTIDAVLFHESEARHREQLTDQLLTHPDTRPSCTEMSRRSAS
jgi:hypothetical protein